MKKVFTLILALVMAMSLVACGGSSSEESSGGDGGEASGGYKIGFSNFSIGNSWRQQMEAEFIHRADELKAEGVISDYVMLMADNDQAQQIDDIRSLVTQGCDAIIVAPNDAGAASGALASAIGSIPVLSVDTNVGIEGQTSFVGTSNVDAAKEGGLWAAEQAGEGANAVIIYGQEGDNTSNMRREGYQAACDEAGVTVLDALSGQNTTDGATKTMEDLLNAYPDQIDIVLCHNDDTAIGAMNACKSAGVDDMIIVGFDGNASAVDLILAGEMVKATVAQQPYEMGYQAVEAALKAIKDETVEEVINAPVTVVTAENGQEYLDSLAAMQG